MSVKAVRGSALVDYRGQGRCEEVPSDFVTVLDSDDQRILVEFHRRTILSILPLAKQDRRMKCSWQRLIPAASRTLATASPE
jgi:hypothetical protein